MITAAILLKLFYSPDLGGCGGCGEDSSFVFETSVHRGAQLVAY